MLAPVRAMALAAGDRLGPYEVLCPIGTGGMGEVYKARDTRLDRVVALKTITSAADVSFDTRQRFAREARAIAALSHPHICTLHDVGSERSIDFIVMEFVDGETLAERIGRGPVSVEDTISLGSDIAGALAAAHQAGLVHGDVKPANVIIGSSGPKLLDFGLARVFRARVEADATVTATVTAQRTVAGTPAYMAPELWRGAVPTPRSDVFALGMVIAEMASGQRDSTVLPPGAPVSLSRVVSRALREDPQERYATAAEVLADLLVCRRELHLAAAPSLTRQALTRMRQPRVGAAVALAALVLVAVAGFTVYRRNRTQVEIRTAQQRIPELMRLVDAARQGDAGKQADAFRLASDLERLLPGDPSLALAWNAIAVRGTLESRPSGARVWIAPYSDVTGDWIELGTTPVRNARVPAGRLRIRAERDGYEPLLVARTGAALLDAFNQRSAASNSPRPPLDALGMSSGLDLQPREPSTARMVWMPPKSGYTPIMFFGFPRIPPVDLGTCWLDKYEVTNAEYKAFIDAGGYSRAEYWRRPFVDRGRTLSWADASRRFVDATGRPGPAGWQLGEYPEGQGNLPVSGVSWYEADAYAAWAGKVLPSAYDMNGEYDWFYIPASRRAFFDLLGSSVKKYRELPGVGHAAPRPAVVHDVDAWLDAHLGPVNR